MKKIFLVFWVFTFTFLSFFVSAQQLPDVYPYISEATTKQPSVCCGYDIQSAEYYDAQNPVRDIEEDMVILSENDPNVQKLIPADEVWFRKNKQGIFREDDPSRFISQDVPYYELRYVKIDDKIYYQFFVSEENLQKKYNPKDLDLSIYRGYILWEAQEDITYIAESFENKSGISEVEIVSQYFLKIYAPIEYVINTYGEDYLNPNDGEYPGYFNEMRLRTAPYLPIKTDFQKDLPEDYNYKTPYMRVFDLTTGEKQAIITMRPNAYPLLPIGFNGNINDLPSEIRKQLSWVDIPTNEPIRKEILYIIHPEKNGAKDATSGEMDMQIYHNAIEVDNDGSNPFNWVIEAWEGSYFIQVGTMEDEDVIMKDHNYARMLDKFDISAFPDATDITGVQYQTYISDTYPTCWDSWIGDCDCLTDYNEIGPEVNNMTNNVTSANNTALGGEKDFNSATWYDDINDGTNYYTDPGWNWDKGDGLTNYDVVYNASGITDFESKLAGNWYVVGVKDRSENNEEPTYWEGIETLNTYSTLRVSFIPTCANTDLGTITPSQCIWQSSNYAAGTIPYWKFDASTSYYYNFTLCSNSEDSYIRIYDSFNNLITSSDDSGPFCSGTPASISWTPSTSGTYYISAAHYSCTDFTNAGTMYYSRSNDAWQRQGTITPTTTWQTSPNTIDKISFWTFTATEGVAYAFNFCDISEDTYIRIFDNTWTQVASADDNGPCCSSSTSASIVWTCPASGTYNIAGMHYSCTGYSNSGNLNYRISIPTAIADASDTEICSGETITLLGDGTAVCGSVVQYDWDHLVGINDPQNPDVSPTGDITYQLRVLDDNGIWSDWASIFITVHPLPTPDLGGNQTVCISETPVTLSPGVYVDYIWNTSSTDSYINVSATGTYSVSVTDSNGCTGEDSMDLTVDPLPTASAGGSQTICVNGTATVSGASATDGTIMWTDNGAGSITSGETGLTPIYSPATGDEGNTVTLTMTVTSNNGCNPQTAIAYYDVDVDPLPIATAGDSQSICVNETATVSGASANYGDILWTEDGAGSITSGETSLTP
ncbi:MAG: hypothetical protein PHH30_10370, partial [Bacteroidales bacterium]|nr:hypothetical protein [Bacteroidales bacterium]